MFIVVCSAVDFHCALSCLPSFAHKEDGLIIRTCFRHLIACLNYVFGWSEAANHSPQIQEVFESIASKIAAGASTAASTQKAASEALEVSEMQMVLPWFEEGKVGWRCSDRAG